MLQKKAVQRKFSTGELGKGNSEKMCLQPAPEGTECLWLSDAGWQAVPTRSSDEEGDISTETGDNGGDVFYWSGGRQNLGL